MRAYEVFKVSDQGYKAVKRGFSWPGFFFTVLWAFSQRLWLQGIILFLIAIPIGAIFLLSVTPGSYLEYNAFRLLIDVAFSLIVGLKGNEWRSRKLQQDHAYVGTISAKDAQDAVAKVAAAGGVIPPELKHIVGSAGLFALPRSLQQLFAIISLTWKAAFRYRVFWVISALLVGAVVGLPILVKDDGTAEGFAQILITYTLGSVSGLLGLCTLWLACGTLARDVEECQMQMVAVKPIARWQIWLGKWLGLVTLNAVLLALAGGCVYGVLKWREQKLPPEVRARLVNEVLIARDSAREDSLDSMIDSETDRIIQDRVKKGKMEGVDLNDARKQLREQVKAAYQSVAPDRIRVWKIHLGRVKDELKDQPLYLRIKFNTAQVGGLDTTYYAVWQIGEAPDVRPHQTHIMSLAPDTFHEFPVPPNLLDSKGDLTVLFRNLNDTALLFPLDDGLEVLYRTGDFGVNFIRGMGIILCWMALLAAVGLAAASFMSFPVAAFSSIAMLFVFFSSGTLSSAVQEGTIMNYNQETGEKGYAPVDKVVIPVFRAMLDVINLVREFSPIDSLSTGRSITWTQLGLAIVQVVVVMGGIPAVFGIFVFTRRELATAQGTQ